MNIISQRSLATPGSGIREMLMLAAKIENPISFALGEPDFMTPKYILDACVESFNRGETHYTPSNGILPLREKISQSYQERKLNYSADEIVVTSGAINALLLAVNVMLDVGDEIILPDPGWSNYMGVVKQISAVPVPVKLKEENGFMYDIRDLEKALTPKTKAILINYPSNPTGSVATPEHIHALAAFVLEHDLCVITDEIYRDIIYTDQPFLSIASLEGMRERTILIDGFSKTYAMTGLRLGYAAAPKEVASEMSKLMANVVSSVPAGIQWAGVAALTEDRTQVMEMKEEYRCRREIALDGLNKIDNISCLRPEGAFYIFANISKSGLTSREFSIRLLEEQQVVVVPGTAFGDSGEGFIRISYATSREQISEGIARIEKFMATL